MNQDDELFRGLAREWQQTQPNQPLPSLEQALRQQRRQRRVQVLQWTLSLLSLGVAGYFFLLPRSPVTVGAGVALVCATLADLWHTLRYRQPVTAWSDWSPQGLLNYRKQLLALELRSARHYVLHALALLVLTALLWGYAWSDPAFAATQFPQFFSACAVPVALFCAVYFGASLRRKRKAQQQLAALVDEFEADS